MSANDPVRPDHYRWHPGVECIDIIEHMSFNVGTAMKHLWRAGRKDDIVIDLRKALFYIEREIARIQAGGAEADGPCPAGVRADIIRRRENAARMDAEIKSIYEARKHMKSFMDSTETLPASEPENPAEADAKGKEWEAAYEKAYRERAEKMIAEIQAESRR